MTLVSILSRKIDAVNIIKYIRWCVTRIVAITILVVILLFSTAEADSVIEYSNSNTGIGFTYNQNNYWYGDRGYFYVRKIDFTKDDDYYISSFDIPGESGKIIYLFDRDNYLVEDIKAGYLKEDTMVIIRTEQFETVLGQAYVYRDLGQGTKESVSSLPIMLTKINGGWRVTYKFKMNTGTYGIMWGVGSEESLGIDNVLQRSILGHHNLTKMSRIGFDGYYYLSPATYEPSTKNSYWKIPSSYLAQTSVRQGDILLTDILANALLHIAAQEVNAEGYFSTLPRSLWLYEEYGIEAGFFDTRFNADMITTYLQAYQKYGIPLYRDMYILMADYYLRHAEINHYLVERFDEKVHINKSTTATANKDIINIDNELIKNFTVNTQQRYDDLPLTGWLVWDYGDSGLTANHTALNHQISAIDLFYMLYLEEGNEEYLRIADKMLNAIYLTEQLWVMDNHNLEYAILPDGNMGYTDYPFLTYNDMFLLQKTLEKIIFKRSNSLERLMKAKRYWMLANNITEYRGYVEEHSHWYNTTKVFRDFSGFEWYAEDVSLLYKNNIIHGYPDSTIRANNDVNVDAFIKLVVSALGFEVELSKPYWASNYITMAIELGLFEEDFFDSYIRRITRGEMAYVVARAVYLEHGIKATQLSERDQTKLKDYNDIPVKVRKEVILCYNLDIIKGFPDGNFAASMTATRATASAVIKRFLDLQ